MNRPLIFITSIMLIAISASAKQANNFDDSVEFGSLNTLSDWEFHRKWVGNLTSIEELTPKEKLSVKENTIATCCFGCPKPFVILKKSCNPFLRLDHVTKVVTKTKGQFIVGIMIS